jgi:hypothetical protein
MSRRDNEACNVVLLDRQKLILVRMPKTAACWIRVILAESFGSTVPPADDIMKQRLKNKSFADLSATGHSEYRFEVAPRRVS